MNRVSLIINTACGDHIVAQVTGRYQSQPYGARVELLRNRILSAAIRDGFDEIILAGVVPDGFSFPGVKIVNSPPQRRDKWDALIQRDTGAMYSMGDVLVFCHDDHMVSKGLVESLRVMPPDVDILVHPRVHGQSGELLNNGRTDGYIGGHYCCVRRYVWKNRPWVSVEPRDTDDAWDVGITRIWQEMGAKISWVDTLPFTDLEIVK